METDEQITQYLRQMGEGDEGAADKLMPLVYQDLRRLADHVFRGQRQGHTLQPTALVNEAYMRIAKAGELSINDRKHFFDVAALAMRQLLTDHARRRNAEKRGAGAERVELEDSSATTGDEDGVDLVELDRALSKLAIIDPRQARIVELRFLAGMTNEEVAEIVGISARSVRLDWKMARTWLWQELSASEAD